MFRFENKRNESSDATAMYDVLLNREYTVKEFIIEALETRPKEWGFIRIKSKDDKWSETPEIEYRYGKAIKGTDLSVFPFDSKIKSIFAHGGWSNMDYFVELEEEVE